MSESSNIEWLETSATAKLLLSLLEGPKYISQLIKTSVNLKGIASQDGIRNARNTLLSVGLIEKYYGEETPRPRLYLQLTGVGIDVAHHLKAIQDIITEEN